MMYTYENIAKQGVPAFSSRGVGSGGTTSGGVGGGGAGGGGGRGSGGSSSNTGYRAVGMGEGSDRLASNGEWQPAYPLEDGEVYTKPVNVESINLVSDEEDDVIITGARKIKKRSGQEEGLRPVRLPRVDHKERVIVLSSDSVTVKKEGSTVPTDITAPEAPTDISPSLLSASPEQTKIKIEPRSPSSPRLRRTQAAVTEGANPPSSSPQRSPTLTKTRIKPPTSPITSKKAPPSAPNKPTEPVFATEEDKAEYHRHLEDVAILARELGDLHSGGRDKGKEPALDTNGDTNMDGAEQRQEGAAREGRLYLFQFPPVLPKLYNPATTKKPPGPNDIKIKKEDESKGPTSPTLSKSKTRSVGKDTIKTEPDAEEVLVPLAPEDPNARLHRDRVVDESGYIGKMIVRKSGKVEFDWGGASLIVSRGVDASFLSTGLILDRGEEGGTNKDGVGKALSMGKIMGKFVVKPDFAKMLGNEF